MTYTPVAGHNGADGFDYRVDDGGSAPSGGESLPATVAIHVLSPVVEERAKDTGQTEFDVLGVSILVIPEAGQLWDGPRVGLQEPAA